MKNKYSSFILVGALIVFLAVAGFFYKTFMGTLPPPSVQDSGGAKESRAKAPEFTLLNREGESVSLEDFRGRAVVLNFWASWCPPCRAEMPEFLELSKELGDEAVLLTVNITDGQRETKATAESFLDEGGYSFEVLFDEGGRVADKYAITGIPATFILDKNGRVFRKIEGQTKKATVQKEIENVLADNLGGAE